jgi:hypothetical protein
VLTSVEAIFVKLVGNDDALGFSDYVGLGLLEAQL